MPKTELVTGVEMNGQVIEGEVMDMLQTGTTSTISDESISLYNKVKEAFKKYDFELTRFYVIGYEAGIVTAGRTNPLTKEEMQDIVKEIGIDFIMVDYSDVNFTWRAFYTSVMDPTADIPGID